MQYLLMLYLDEAGWGALSPAEREQRSAAYTAYTEALKNAGAFKGADRLQPSATATTVRVNGGGRPQVQDGPFADAKEQLGGYYLIEAGDLDQAIAWAAKCPTASHGTVEVRPIWSM